MALQLPCQHFSSPSPSQLQSAKRNSTLLKWASTCSANSPRTLRARPIDSALSRHLERYGYQRHTLTCFKWQWIVAVFNSLNRPRDDIMASWWRSQTKRFGFLACWSMGSLGVVMEFYHTAVRPHPQLTWHLLLHLPPQEQWDRAGRRCQTMCGCVFLSLCHVWMYQQAWDILGLKYELQSLVNWGQVL